PGDDPYDPSDPDGPDHRTEVPAEQVSKLLLEKESELSEDGNTITYTFKVTNIGTVTIEDIEVTDVMIPEGITLDKTTLEPQDFAIGIVVYAVTNLDRDAGQVENQAEVTGTPPPTAPVLPPTPSVDPKNPTEPDGKTITEVPSVIEAENDRFGTVQFGEETPSVIENDTYNGNTPTI